MKRLFSSYIDLQALILFLLLFGILYSVDLTWIAMTAKGGILYSPFVSEYVNYPEWIRNAVLSLANQFCHLLHVPTVRSGASTLDIVHGRGIYMGYSCYGLEIMDLWITFILVERGSTKTKCLWGVGGLAGIFLINVGRIAFLVISNYRKLSLFDHLDHHTVFNISAYCFILLLVAGYYKRKRLSFKKNAVSS